VEVGANGRATLANAEDRPLNMTLLFAAFGATVAALLESSVVPYLRLGDAQPHLVFVFAVVVTVVGGFDRGLVWAFVGGLLLDILTQRPLGVSAFALLVCVGGVAGLGRLLSRARPLLPIIATLLLSLVYSMSLFVTYAALGDSSLRGDPLALFGPSVAYDTVLAALIGPLLVSIADRRADAERVEW
jgi:rod shape-determining protein MreD